MENFYAVRKGRKTGIYRTWDEAKEQVLGFSGAEYKKFLSETDAEGFMKAENKSNQLVSNDIIDQRIEQLKPNELIAFTDGSFDKWQNRYGYAVILITKNSQSNISTEYLYQSFEHRENNERNISGELRAVMEAIRWAMNNEFKKISIYYDYMGIGKWATDEWQARKSEPKKYVEFIKSCENIIELEFFKVPAHSKIIYNERVDGLAKGSLKRKQYRTNEDGSVYFNYPTSGWWDEIKTEIANDENAGNYVEFNEYQRNFGVVRTIVGGSGKVTITEYNSGVFVQGNRDSKIMNLVISTLTFHLSGIGNIVKALNGYQGNNIDEDKVRREFQKLFPDVSLLNLDPEVLSTLQSIAYNVIFSGYKPDYTDLLFPLCRISDHLLSLQVKKFFPNKVGKNGYINYGRVGIFDSANKPFVIKEAFKQSSYWTNEQCEIYCSIYNNYYLKYRNNIFHFGPVPEQVFQLIDVENAKDILKDGSKVINEYYKLF